MKYSALFILLLSVCLLTSRAADPTPEIKVSIEFGYIGKDANQQLGILVDKLTEYPGVRVVPVGTADADFHWLINIWPNKDGKYTCFEMPLTPAKKYLNRAAIVELSEKFSEKTVESINESTDEGFKAWPDAYFIERPRLTFGDSTMPEIINGCIQAFNTDCIVPLRAQRQKTEQRRRAK